MFVKERRGWKTVEPRYSTLFFFDRAMWFYNLLKSSKNHTQRPLDCKSEIILSVSPGDVRQKEITPSIEIPCNNWLILHNSIRTHICPYLRWLGSAYLSIIYNMSQEPVDKDGADGQFENPIDYFLWKLFLW